jgi:6-phosphogluconolactonase (cycloisomerase 2 family)
VANATTETVSGFAVGTGTLTAVTSSPYQLSFVPTAVAVNPANTILFVAGNSLIYAYSIGSGGALTALNSGSAVAISDVVSMDISPDGQWLLVLDGNGITIDEFLINSTTGGLSQVAGASYSISGATVLPRAIKVAPNGDLVFVALGGAGDLVFTFNTTSGAMASSQQLSLSSTTTSDNALAVSPSSSYLYIARSGTAGGLAVYSIGTNGALTSVSGSPFAAGTQPYSVVLNKAGTDVYLANRGDNTISGYSVASTGTLTALSGSPYTSGSAVTALAVDNSADYLLAASNGGSPDLTMYSFDSSIVGKLDLSTTSSTGTDPTGAVAIAATH